MKTFSLSLLPLLLVCFDYADAYFSDSNSVGRFMYSISTVSNSKNLDLAVTSEGCANSCDVGDSIVQTGELTIYEEFDEQICVNLVLTMSFGSSTSTGSGDLCEVFNVKSVDGSSECPAPGDYTFSANMTVTSLTNGFSFSVKESLYSCDESGDVDLTISGTITSLNAMAYGVIGLAGIVCAIVACQKRRRRVETEADRGQQSCSTNIDFQEMEDSAYVA